MGQLKDQSYYCADVPGGGHDTDCFSQCDMVLVKV